MSDQTETPESPSPRALLILMTVFLSPWLVMFGAGNMGWAWSFWKSFWVEAAVCDPLMLALASAIVFANDIVKHEAKKQAEVDLSE